MNTRVDQAIEGVVKGALIGGGAGGAFACSPMMSVCFHVIAKDKMGLVGLIALRLAIVGGGATLGGVLGAVGGLTADSASLSEQNNLFARVVEQAMEDEDIDNDWLQKLIDKGACSATRAGISIAKSCYSFFSSSPETPATVLNLDDKDNTANNSFQPLVG